MAQVERFKGKDGQFYWHLRDGNNEIVCSGEGHPQKESVQRAVNNVAAEFHKLFAFNGKLEQIDVSIVDVDPQ